MPLTSSSPTPHSPSPALSPAHAASSAPSPAHGPAPFRLPRPPGTDAPATCEVPPFGPVRVRGGRYRLQRLAHRRGGALAAGLVVTAAALVAAGPRTGAPPHPSARAPGRPAAEPPGRHHRAVDVVTAPVRIADAATVRLLRPGDRVDVIAAGDPSTGGDARVLARGVRVREVPEPLEGADGSADGGGALVVLTVPRGSAARLVGASATARLAVTLC
ncbi:RcpC/CpaB family pilus assembly protein [Streptomyces collinus]|uniref:RcpC/CpaB family pilus assembly protein n=1 Tax=Streptomyces collinus TaxID=42684 RepID=UPI002942A977|nr:RcpC/CpaB family pilus assembly protein [Streptomyces collinus]